MRQRTKLERRRRTAIIHILSDLSRGGWQCAKPVDYRALEAELRDLETEGEDDQ